MSKVELHRAQAQAMAARERFMGTLHELQHRLSPKTIAHDVKEKAKEKADGAVTAAKGQVANARENPGKAAAVAVPVALFLFRKPIWRGLKALFAPRHHADAPALQPYEQARHPAPLSTQPISAPERAVELEGA